jgi:hypothetical protein
MSLTSGKQLVLSTAAAGGYTISRSLRFKSNNSKLRQNMRLNKKVAA